MQYILSVETALEGLLNTRDLFAHKLKVHAGISIDSKLPPLIQNLGPYRKNVM
jgi:hypothetical protein